MQAFEFSTTIANGVIQLPIPTVRVIVLAEEKSDGSTQKQNLREILAKMKNVEMFKSIDKPSEWQKKMRDEWD